MQTRKIELGDEVKDTITGFKGTAVARTEWITGCNRINVQPKIDKDGKLPDTCSFDEPMLVITKAKKQPKADKKIGGPRLTVMQKQ